MTPLTIPITPDMIEVISATSPLSPRTTTRDLKRPTRRDLKPQTQDPPPRMRLMILAVGAPSTASPPPPRTTSRGMKPLTIPITSDMVERTQAAPPALRTAARMKASTVPVTSQMVESERATPPKPPRGMKALTVPITVDMIESTRSAPPPTTARDMKPLIKSELAPRTGPRVARSLGMRPLTKAPGK